MDPNIPAAFQAVDRRKRPAQDAFGEDRTSHYLKHETFEETGGTGHSTLAPMPADTGGLQDMSTSLMAQMLGFAMPGVGLSTSYYPGYEWWPRTDFGSQALDENMQYTSETTFDASIGVVATPQSADSHWDSQGGNSEAPTEQNYVPNILQPYGYEYRYYGV